MKATLQIILALIFSALLAACGGATPSIAGSDSLDVYESGGTLTGDPSEPNPDPTMSDGSPVIPHTNDFAGWAGSLSAALCSKFQDCGYVTSDENECIATLAATPGLPATVGIPELTTFAEMFTAQRNAWFGASNGREDECVAQIQQTSCDEAYMTGFSAAPTILANSPACFQVLNWISDLTCSGAACAVRPSGRPITDSTTTAPVDATAPAGDTVSVF